MPPKNEPKDSDPKEFLVVALPEATAPGTMLRLLEVTDSLAKAEKLVTDLDPSTLGHVAVLERRRLFLRRQVVDSVAVTDPILPKK
jgi:hypothetical protein